jgi:hypothetical protein
MLANLILLYLFAISAILSQPTAIPIWISNETSNFALFSSPEFSLRLPNFITATIYFSALGSPRQPRGTVQSKLLGAAAIYVNGILVTAGPGHNVPTNSTGIRTADVTAFIRGNGNNNVIGVSCFWAREFAQFSPVPGGPRLSVTLVVIDSIGSYSVLGTTTSWMSLAADTVFNPTGEVDGSGWYPMPNENLNRNAYPLGWSSPQFQPSIDWKPSVAAPAFPAPYFLIKGLAPVTLARQSCAVHTFNSSTQVIDFGTELMGGVNFSFPNAIAGSTVRVTLSETLNIDGSVLAPTKAGNFWSSVWTLAGDERDFNIVQHEFIQFRYAEVVYSSPTIPRLTKETAQVWIIQHNVGGTGINPYDLACEPAIPSSLLWGSGAPTQQRIGNLSSSSVAFNTVFEFCASTIIATTLDVNVDGQTRERDVDVVDALNTARGQYSIFSPGDVAIAERTARECLTNDTGAWTQWYDFHASTVLLIRDHTLFTGDLSIGTDAWAQSDFDIRGADSNYNSLQWNSGLRYFNSTGNGLLHFPANGSCGGTWSCDPLVDWPTTTRDGYDCGSDNSDDTVRSAFGAMAFTALADLAIWLPNIPKARADFYSQASGEVQKALKQLNLRQNGTEAYFVDGAVGKSSTHNAVHSTVYAISAGAADGDATLGAALTAFLRRHGVAPASCMMGRWFVDGLYRIGLWSSEATDLAFDILTSSSYPSWLDMLAQGATTTTEAWRAADKSNMDWAHPWCASPSFTSFSGTIGALPTLPGWKQWRLWPQPSELSSLIAAVPTPQGFVDIQWIASADLKNSTVSFNVLSDQLVQVCVPRAGRAGQAPGNSQNDTLFVNGNSVVAEFLGRMLCASTLLGNGTYTVSRIVNV